jgi:pyridoxal/pyridoxine/pyridoxamine kinase
MMARKMTVVTLVITVLFSSMAAAMEPEDNIEPTENIAAIEIADQVACQAGETSMVCALRTLRWEVLGMKPVNLSLK